MTFRLVFFAFLAASSRIASLQPRKSAKEHYYTVSYVASEVMCGWLLLLIKMLPLGCFLVLMDWNHMLVKFLHENNARFAKTICRGGPKCIFRGGPRNRLYFSQLKMTVCRGGYKGRPCKCIFGGGGVTRPLKIIFLTNPKIHLNQKI